MLDEWGMRNALERREMLRGCSWGNPQGKIMLDKGEIGDNIARGFKEAGWDALEWRHVVPDRDR